MNKLIKDKGFKSGVFIGLISLSLINFLNYLAVVNFEFKFHYILYFGFPFVIFDWNNFSATSRRFHLMGLIGDILFSIVFSFVLGLIFKFLWSKFLNSHKIK